MTPADELTAAADRIRKLASTATAGPWANEVSPVYGFRVGTADRTAWVAFTGDYGDEPEQSAADADYIAAMHPGVGEKIAGWLEREAFRVLHNGRDGELHHALAVARAINEAQP